MTRTKLVLLVSILTILLTIFGVLGWWLTRGEFGSDHSPWLKYTNLKVQITNSVGRYMIDNQGKLPTGTTSSIGAYNVSGVGTCYIIDFCQISTSLVPIYRGFIPDGFAKLNGDGNDNFDDPACNLSPSSPGQHYVWVVSKEGEVYSVCDENSDGVIEPSESTDGFSGSLIYKQDIWP